MCHVGNVHLKMPVAIGPALYVNGVIEIARRFAINRDNRQAAKILTAGALRITDRRGALLGFLHDFGGEKVWKMVFADDDFGVDPEFARAPQDFDNAAGWRGACPRIASQLD